MNTDKIYAESVLNEYTKKEDGKALQLKKLDRKAKSGANIFAYTFGVIVTLAFGTGMCLSMGVIGGNTTLSITFGIVIGIISFLLMGLNYLIYKKLIQRGKEKYGSDIIRLATEIANEANEENE